MINIVGSAAIYLIVWALVLFVVLPWGSQSHAEMGADIESGTEPGAPVRPMMWRKVFITSIIAAIITATIMYLLIVRPFSLDQIPGLPTFNADYCNKKDC